MRIVLGLLAAAATIAIGGCQSEASAKKQVREKAVSTCEADLQQRGPAAASLDAQKFCGCVADKMMEGRSVSDLQKFQPSPQQQQEWGVNCAMSSLRAGAQQAPAAAPAAGTAPAPAAEEASEDAAEGETEAQ
ncbi:MAG TPA: hypothetical protein VGB54_04020 [Allosphingosinicella sp.]